MKSLRYIWVCPLLVERRQSNKDHGQESGQLCDPRSQVRTFTFPEPTTLVFKMVMPILELLGLHEMFLHET